MMSGSPSLRRSRPMVTWTVLVKGSAFSSQAWARRSSALRAAGRGFQQGFEHGELLGREVELPPVAGDGAAQRVELDPGGAQDAGPGGGLAAGQGADAQHEFGEVEGLGQVVVGAEAEAGDPVGGGAGGGEHEHHDRLPLSVIIRQMVSPWMPGRSRSSTSTS